MSTNLDVAAEAICGNYAPLTDREAANIRTDSINDTRAALDAIHPALAHLTPDDVATYLASGIALKRVHDNEHGGIGPRGCWRCKLAQAEREVLSRD